MLITAWMVLALGHPLPEQVNTSALQEAQTSYEAMLQIFTPSLRILIASLISYLCSQWLDITIFNRLRTLTNGKFLWLRQNVAMFMSGLFDNFMFSWLAWMCLSQTPITWE